MRRLLVLFLMLTLLLVPTMAQAADAPIRLYVNGAEVVADVPPVIEGGRTLVPLRALTEALGFKVTWDPMARAATLTKGDTTIVLYIDKPSAMVNGKAVGLDVPPAIRENRTLIPVRFVAEQLGLKVTWDGENRVVRVAPQTDETAGSTGSTGSTGSSLQDGLALITNAKRFENQKITGKTIMDSSADGESMVIESNSVEYIRGEEELQLITQEMEGMSLEMGYATYEGDHYQKSFVMGWQRAEELPKDPNDVATEELNEASLQDGTVTVGVQSRDGVSMKTVTIVWGNGAVERKLGRDPDELADGQMKMVYWIDAAGELAYMDHSVSFTDLTDGSTMKMDSTYAYEELTGEIPFPAEIKSYRR